MSSVQIVEVEGIGPVMLEHSARARRLTITVNLQGRIRAAVPLRVSFESALVFVRQKKNWIKKTMARIELMHTRQRPLVTLTNHLDKEQAKVVLVTRLTELAKMHGFHFNRVYVRNQKTRWGSYSHKGDVSLNMKIMVLSEEMRDYVLLHELVHSKIYNHSPRFWAELKKYVPDAKAKDARLRWYDLRLL
ncbi:MAG TPA: M48 family metallopeptidase [Dehalococcoidales bacterium]|nr:M48 family metallopeptidase [Dehalococcoidales bacterium]